MTDINKENLYLLLPGIIAGIARIYAEDKRCSEIEAIQKIYASELYPRLADESSKLWHLGPVALYEELLNPSL
ncbi:MAG: hypothetical protein ACI3ZC_00865 [Candidatus Cryptobacteroides sp.]